MTELTTPLLPLLHVDRLLDLAAAAGLPICRDVNEEDANLYDLVDRWGHSLYIGQAADAKRHRDEARFSLSLDHTQETVSGYVALRNANGAIHRTLQYDPGTFDAALVLEHLKTHPWTGAGVDLLRTRHSAGMPPTLNEVEAILIRIHVRLGRLIGNSVHASQWEGPVGSYADTFAALATDSARVRGTI